MNSFRNLLTPAQERRLCALDSWHGAFDNIALLMESPDAYHEELLRQSDEMDRQRIVSWEEWRDLRIKADQAFLRAVAGEDVHAALSQVVDQLLMETSEEPCISDDPQRAV